MDLKSTDKVLVHACCAPCSGAILEWLVGQGVRPTVFFSNANIYPLAEYELRRGELLRYAAQLGQKASGSNQEAACSTQEASGSNQEAACSTQEASDGGQGPGSQEPRGLAVIDDVYDHEAWRHDIRGLELAPERGERCTVCFRHRLLRTARWGVAHGFEWLTTTLASSRWKDLQQVNEAGEWATAQTPGISYWPQDWRKGGLQLRRSALIKFFHFYNQPYCGCEMSLAQTRARMAQRGTANPSCQASFPDDNGGE